MADAYARTYFANEGVYIEDGNDLPDYVDDQLDDIPASVWTDGGDCLRGKKIDQAKKIENNLGENFPVCDTLYDGVLGSTKSYDTSRDSYSTTKGWLSKLKSDINRLDGFTEKTWNSVPITKEMYSSKCFNIVIPNCELTEAQQAALQQAKDYAASLKIDVKVYITQ